MPKLSEKLSNLFAKTKTLFKERLDLVIIMIGIFIFISIFSFSIVSLYRLNSLKKSEPTTSKKFEINQNLYKEVKDKIDQKKKINEKYIKEKIDPLPDMFEKK